MLYTQGPFEIDGVSEGGTFRAYLDPSQLGGKRIHELFPDFRVTATFTGSVDWYLEVLGPANAWVKVTPDLAANDLVVWGRAHSWVIDNSAGTQQRIASFRPRRMRVTWSGAPTNPKAHVELDARGQAG